MPTHYKILQVKKDATEKEIVSAYRKLAKKYHPDVKGGNAAKFEQIHESYFVLSDPLRRRAYDMQLNIINEHNIISKLFRGYAYSMLSGVLLVYSLIFFIISFFEIDYYYILFLSLAMMTFAMSIFLLVKHGEG
jgi:curved DNA-binding protein CbpA